MVVEIIKRSLVEKDSEIIRLRDEIIENDQVALEFRSNLTSIFRDGFQGQLDEAMAKVSKFVLGAKARLDDVVPLVATFMYPFLDKVVGCCDRSLADLAGLEPGKLARPVPILITLPGSSLTSPPSPKELNVTPASPLKELASTDNPSSSFADKDKQPSKEQTKEWVEEMINKSKKEMAEAEVDKTVEVVILVPSAASSDVTVALATTEEGKDAPIVDQNALAPSRV
ncbi:hypothetical protein Tco_1275756 [Tanacetum coccineum]